MSEEIRISHEFFLARDNSHHCYDCNINFELSTMLLMHNLDIHRKTGISHRKISSFLSNLLENEIIYSSDSECEYRVTTTVRRITKIKPEIKVKNDSDDDAKSSNRIARTGSIAAIKREAIEVDRSDSNVDCEITCHICGVAVESEQCLKEHITNDHDGGKECDNDINFLSEFSKENDGNCSSEIDSKLEQPRKRLRTKKFSCDVCSKPFRQKAALVKHLKQHSQNDEVDMKNEINDDISDNWDTDDSDSLNSKTKTTTGFPCNLCGKIYEKKVHILKHFKTFHPHDEDALGVTMDVINKHEGVGFPCTSCPSVHPNRDSLHRHMRRAHQIRNKDNENRCWTCEICGKIFYRPKCFATHLRKHNDTIVEKRRTKSPKKKTHLCSFCGKSYPGSNHLKIHLRIHTGERPFKCDYCDKTFAIKKTWQDHTYSHTGEKPYFCPVENCGKRFTHSTGVRQHIQCCHSSEKQFQCPHCDKKCSKKTHLEDHIRSHTGERPYECKYCGIKFRLTSTLRIHHRTHTGERPFVCKVCNRGFIKSYGLKQHMKSKRNCLPTSVQPTLTSEIEQQQQHSIENATEDIQFHQLLILPSHQGIS